MLKNSLKGIVLTGLIIVSSVCDTLSQSVYKLSGIVTDSLTMKPLIGVTVFIQPAMKGISTDTLGNFTIWLDKGLYTINLSYLGYNSISTKIDVDKDTLLLFALNSSAIEIKEVFIRKENENGSSRGIISGMVELTRKEMEILPALLGEHDPVRTLQYMPGVRTVTDGDMGIYVRGGSPDQNLILYDNAVVYNPSHVLGFFSIFNEDAVSTVKFYKSGIPSNYGNRLASVIDINSYENFPETLGAEGTIGIISSKVKIRVPVSKNNGGLFVSFRKSYIDEVVEPVIGLFNKNTYSFYEKSEYFFNDLNGKIYYKLGNKNIVTFSYYLGKDNFKTKQLGIQYKNSLYWGNKTASLNWKQIFDNNSFLVHTLYYSQYEFNFNANQNQVYAGLYSGVRDIGYRLSYTKMPQAGRKYKMGFDYQKHLFRPNNMDVTVNEFDLQFSPNRKLYSHEAALYFNGEITLNSKLAADAGIRLTGFIHTGPYEKYLKNEIGEITDTLHYKKNEFLSNYFFAEPHLALRYSLSSSSSLKYSFQYNCQYIHLLSSAAVTIPIDVWLPSTDFLKPQKGWQMTLGYFKDFKNKTFVTYADLYYKELYHQVELLYGIINSYADNLFEETMVFGMGRSYGIELFIQKNKGKFNGWIGYTLSRTEKQFDDIADGLIYPAKYDRRHDVKVVGSYTLNKKWNFSGAFIFSSGVALTLPIEKYLIEGNVINAYGPTNSFRMPAYHRLDISLIYNAKKTKKFESEWVFSIFNVYNRQNPFYIYFEYTGDLESYNLTIEAKQITIFPVIPSIAWNFKF